MKSSREIAKTLIIGCGNIAHGYHVKSSIQEIYTHAHSYSVHDKTHLAAVCDIDIEKAKACAEFWGDVAYYDDIKKALEIERPSFVSICTPGHTHLDVFEIVSNYDFVKSIWLEKPVEVNFEKGQRILEIAQQKDIFVNVYYTRRFSNLFPFVHKKLQEGSLGKITKIHGVVSGDFNRE